VEVSAKPVSEAHVVTDDAGVLRLAGGQCAECDAFSFPRAQVCVGCLSEDIVISALPDSGVLYSYAVIRVGDEHEKLPYAIGYVDLSNGVRVLSRLTDMDQLSVDMPVSLHVARDGKGDSGALYKFWAAPKETANA
jgi:uncharacterized OB-fold protein